MKSILAFFSPFSPLMSVINFDQKINYNIFVPFSFSLFVCLCHCSNSFIALCHIHAFLFVVIDRMNKFDFFFLVSHRPVS